MIQNNFVGVEVTEKEVNSKSLSPNDDGLASCMSSTNS